MKHTKKSNNAPRPSAFAKTLHRFSDLKVATSHSQHTNAVCSVRFDCQVAYDYNNCSTVTVERVLFSEQGEKSRRPSLTMHFGREDEGGTILQLFEWACEQLAELRAIASELDSATLSAKRGAK